MSRMSGYRIDFGRAMFYWLGNVDSIKITYRVLPPFFTKTYQHKDRRLIEPSFGAFGNMFEYTPTNADVGLFDKQGLEMKGSVSRGLGFGNSQDLTISSNLNLQISGKLNNDVEVLAAVSDDNNPIQPEGNTQQLQDFDRVFIQFSKKQTKLTLGDFQMLKPEGNYFLNYNKKSRGMSVAHGQQLKRKWNYKATADLALSRGRFSRNTIAGLEGNQGPYRLKGVNGEIFIIIISGTEAMYLDGERLQRGEQNDYTINYNTGEVTFTPRHLITAFSRIVVEFQYSDRNYARSVYTLGNNWDWNKKLKLRVDYFSEQDNKNQPFQRTLSDTDKYIISQAGNDPSKAVIGSEIKVESFDRSRILYRKLDSIVAGFPYPIYLYTTDPTSDTVFYSLGFSFVGEGNGNYRIAANSANGRVYEWLAPLNGKTQGSFEPLTQLIAPNKLQMLTAGIDWQVDSNTQLSVDYARSTFDRNTFSAIGNTANSGNGIKAKLSHRKYIDSTRKWLLNTTVNYEQVDRNFRYVERYRPVEFERQWNRRLQNESRKDTGYDEQIGNANFSIRKADKFLLGYGLSYYNRNKALTGFTNTVGGYLHGKKAALYFSGELNELKPNLIGLERTQFYRFKVMPSYTFKKLKVYANAENELSRFKPIGKDSLLDGSYAYKLFGGGISSADSAKLNYQLDYYHREDGLSQQQFVPKKYADNIALNLQHQSKRGNRLKLNATLRNFIDETVPTHKPEKNLLLRFEYDLNLFNRMVSLNTYYQIGTGQELKRQYSYLEVQPGMGVYQWNDYNQDSLQQLNEFELAVFKDKARFIRVFLPTTEYVGSSNLQLNQTVQWNPGNSLNEKKGILKYLKKFNDVAVFRIDRKTYTGQQLSVMANPFLSGLPDSDFVSLNSLVRNTLFYNRSNPKWGMDFNWQGNNSKQLLTNGIDARKRIERELNFRYTLNRSYILKATVSNGIRGYFSQFFSQYNFDYSLWQWKPSIDFQQGSKFRMSVFYSGFIAANRIGPERTSNMEFGSEFRYGFKANGTLTARYSFNRIQYTGEDGTPVAFDMLNGLLNGNNQVWSLQIQHRISSNIQINISYDGRKSATNALVHIARAEARYLF